MTPAPLNGWMVGWSFRSQAPGLYGWDSVRKCYDTPDAARAAYEAPSPYGALTIAVDLFEWIDGKLHRRQRRKFRRQGGAS